MRKLGCERVWGACVDDVFSKHSGPGPVHSHPLPRVGRSLVRNVSMKDSKRIAQRSLHARVSCLRHPRKLNCSSSWNSFRIQVHPVEVTAQALRSQRGSVRKESASYTSSFPMQCLILANASTRRGAIESTLDPIRSNRPGGLSDRTVLAGRCFYLARAFANEKANATHPCTFHIKDIDKM